MIAIRRNKRITKKRSVDQSVRKTASSSTSKPLATLSKEKPVTTKKSTVKPTSEQVAQEKPTSEQVAQKKPTSEQVAQEKPTSEQEGTVKPTSDKLTRKLVTFKNNHTNNGSPSHHKENPETKAKSSEKKVNIQVNPLHQVPENALGNSNNNNNKKKETIVTVHRHDSSTFNHTYTPEYPKNLTTEGTNTPEPSTAADKEVRQGARRKRTQNERTKHRRRRRHSRNFISGSLSSIEEVTDSDECNRPPPSPPDPNYTPEPYYKETSFNQHNFPGITGVITPELCRAIAHGRLVSSKKISDQRYYPNSTPKRPSSADGRFYSQWAEFESDHDTAPPSPAPSTPLNQRTFHDIPTGSRPQDYDYYDAHQSNWTHWEEPRRTVKASLRFVRIRTPVNAEGYHYKFLDECSYQRKTRCTSSNDYYRDEFRSRSYEESDRWLPYDSAAYEDFLANEDRLRYRLRKQTEKINMISMGDHERKIIIEFCHLLEKSKLLFNGLRELPQYGHKQWSVYFGRTFDIYTRLWKYQQQHREILDTKYGLKRWQIGEVASKIGQLYYHFYLRTSETAYLIEANAFYDAIRSRCYYTKANKEDKCELMVKKLRYYARFIVVSLLLKHMKLVKELIKELDRQIIEYGNTYDPEDQVEWAVVVDEVKAFVHAEPVVVVIKSDNCTVSLSHRLPMIVTPPIERSPQMSLTLQEIVIVGSCSQQVKFSELTMDMYRILQTLERDIPPEPPGDKRTKGDSPRPRPTFIPAAAQDTIESGPKIPNPHKFLLFKPSPSQMLVYLSSGFHELVSNGVLLLYISADGLTVPSSKQADDGYDCGGLITTSKNDIYRECKDSKGSASKIKESHCVYPGDLYSYTRRPFFLIVDSDNSYAFQSIPRYFGQPVVVLMSPIEVPVSFHDHRIHGSLFTLFLHSPLTAMCYCCDISNLPYLQWDRGMHYIESFMAEATALLLRSRIDSTYISFMGDDFLRTLITRYVFCEVMTRMHRGFRARTHLPRCTPALPDDLFEHPALVHVVMDLASHLQVRSHFFDPNLAPAAPTTRD